MSEKFAQIKNLNVVYETKKNAFGNVQKVFAVNGVNLDVNKGEILAIAGESGCGKSTLAKAVMKLVDINSGEITVDGIDISKINKNEDLKKFCQKVQIIFQNPYSSLNPKMKIGEILREPLDINTKLSKEEKEQRVKETIKKVGLDENSLTLYPHEFSGGQRQRIAIARALILEPEFIIADEPVSALDVSIQAQIINLLKQLKEDYNLTFLFISHDLSVIKYLSDRIAVMYLGEIVEIGTTEEIFSDPKHPYTKALLSSVPQLIGDKRKDTAALQGELPSPENLPQGCRFHTRCPYVKEECKSQQSANYKFSESHFCRCFLYK